MTCTFRAAGFAALLVSSAAWVSQAQGRGPADLAKAPVPPGAILTAAQRLLAVGK